MEVQDTYLGYDKFLGLFSVISFYFKLLIQIVNLTSSFFIFLCTHTF